MPAMDGARDRHVGGPEPAKTPPGGRRITSADAGRQAQTPRRLLPGQSHLASPDALRYGGDRMALLVDKEVEERLGRLEIPFNACGVDPFGVSRDYLGPSFTFLGFLYRRYFAVKVFGLENVPPRGRAMLVGNHSGGVAVDGAMVCASVFFDMEPPRL